MSISTEQDIFASLGLSSQAGTTRGTNDATELGLNTFLKLMVTQLNNQDPFQPMENGDFLGQIAQFASVTGIEQLNQNFGGLSTSLTSGQALQAGSLIGKQVLAPVEDGFLTADRPITGQVDAGAAGVPVTMRVYDIYNQLVREMPLGTSTSEPMQFAWDGINDGGEFAGQGIYKIRLQGETDDGQVDLQTQLFSSVESVNMNGNSGLTLNLEGLGPIAFSNVQQLK
ncbi:MAG: flagellar hook assembly protein FlgD [Gammaproteobacteria bacterium]|nr:flagellar hook assembly protein FlgD [Gammaproteobacteria bacterium]